MKKIFIVSAVLSMLVLACNNSGKRAAEPGKNSKEISVTDSLETQIDSVKNAIDSSVKEVDRLIEDL